jgi:divalent metal cation (Fe/Co/Zn/Cd) transporter
MDSASENLAIETLSDKRGKQRIATWSVIASSGLAALKFAVGLLTGSLGLIAEAAHSLLDLVSTLITLLVVRVAAIPPDRDHPYGHEKAENLGALAGMALLAATAAFILYHAIIKIFVHPTAPSESIYTHRSADPGAMYLGVDHEPRVCDVRSETGLIWLNIKGPDHPPLSHRHKNLSTWTEPNSARVLLV